MTPKKTNALAVTKPEFTLAQKEEQEAFKALVLKTMPEFVAHLENKEDVGNAMYESAQEMLLVVVDVLTRYFKFTDEDIKRFSRELNDILTGAKEFEKSGISVMTSHSVGVVGDIVQEKGIGGLMSELAQIRFEKNKLQRVGWELPMTPEATIFAKKLKEVNDRK